MEACKKWTEEEWQEIMDNSMPIGIFRPYFKKCKSLDEITPQVAAQKRCHVMYTPDGNQFMAVYNGWVSPVYSTKEQALAALGFFCSRIPYRLLKGVQQQWYK